MYIHMYIGTYMYVYVCYVCMQVHMYIQLLQLRPVLKSISGSELERIHLRAGLRIRVARPEIASMQWRL
jgi:hypothetical protein